MILTLILIVVSLVSIGGLALVTVNAEASAAFDAVIKRKGIVGVPLGCLLGTASVICLGLWTWYAIDVREWRFAAIVWIPMVCKFLGWLAKKGTAKV